MIISYLQCGTDIEKNETRDISDLKRRFSEECRIIESVLQVVRKEIKKTKLKKDIKTYLKKPITSLIVV